MEKKSFQMDIRLDEKKLREKYPNYRYFSSTDEFLKFLLANIIPKDTVKIGYSVTVTPIHNK